MIRMQAEGIQFQIYHQPGEDWCSQWGAVRLTGIVPGGELQANGANRAGLLVNSRKRFLCLCFHGFRFRL